MEKSIPVTQPANEPVDYQAAIKQLFEEIDRVNTRIETHQIETEKLRAVTRARLAGSG